MVVHGTFLEHIENYSLVQMHFGVMGRDFHFIYSSLKIRILRMFVLTVLLTFHCCDKEHGSKRSKKEKPSTNLSASPHEKMIIQYSTGHVPGDRPKVSCGTQ